VESEVVTVPKPIKHKFYVAMRPDGSGAGRASCVDDDRRTVREFFRDYAGLEIRHVDGEEMRRLMTL
jgi:hypothetical protein